LATSGELGTPRGGGGGGGGGGARTGQTEASSAAKLAQNARVLFAQVRGSHRTQL
jgi:hypothetical protein